MVDEIKKVKSQEHINYIKEYNSNFDTDEISVMYEISISDGYKMSYMDIEEEITSRFEYQTVKRIVLLSVEVIQNIIKHRDTTLGIDNSIFFICKVGDIILIVGGNVVDETTLNRMVSRIDCINAMDTEQLTRHYFDVLNNKGFSEKGGAGLGLIEMVRKTKHKLDYVIKPIDENYSYIYTVVTHKVS